MKTVDDVMCSGREDSSFSTSGTRRVSLFWWQFLFH